MDGNNFSQKGLDTANDLNWFGLLLNVKKEASNSFFLAPNRQSLNLWLADERRIQRVESLRAQRVRKVCEAVSTFPVRLKKSVSDLNSHRILELEFRFKATSHCYRKGRQVLCL